MIFYKISFSKEKTMNRVRWTPEEKSALHVGLGRYFYTKDGTLPGMHEITQCVKKRPYLANILWHNIKDFIRVNDVF